MKITNPRLYHFLHTGVVSALQAALVALAVVALGSFTSVLFP